MSGRQAAGVWGVKLVQLRDGARGNRLWGLTHCPFKSFHPGVSCLLLVTAGAAGQLETSSEVRACAWHCASDMQGGNGGSAGVWAADWASIKT